MRCEGKTVVVTGAESGMGRATALAFAEEGGHVHAADVAHPTPFSDIRITEHALDVQREGDWEALAEAIAAESGRVDVLVNGAGVVDYAAIDEVDLGAWRRTVAIDLDGVMLGMRAMIPLMKTRVAAPP